MALPPTVLDILCNGNYKQMYKQLKVNNCLSDYALNNKEKFYNDFENFNKKLLEEESKDIRPVVGISSFDRKVRFLTSTEYLNEYAYALQNMGLNGYEQFEICDNCQKLFLKTEYRCFNCQKNSVICKKEAKQGNLLEESDATFIVNASNSRLLLGSGVSMAFEKHCGIVLQEEMNLKLQEYGTLYKGDVVMTSSGEANNFIYSLHAVIMDYKKGGSQFPTIENIEEVLNNIELYMDWYIENHNSNTIKLVLPLLGCGVGGLDKQDVLRCYNSHFYKKRAYDCQVVIYGYNYEDYRLIQQFSGGKNGNIKGG